MKKTSIFAFSAIIYAAALGQNAWAGLTNWPKFGKITAVSEDPSGLYVWTSINAGVSECSGSRLYISHEKAEQLRSLIYMAYATEKNLYVYSGGCKNQWAAPFTTVQSIYVE